MGRVVAEPRPRGGGVFEELIKRYGRLVKAAVARVTRRHGTLDDDIDQRVATALWRKVEGADAIEHPSTYIYR